jgi:hypothetical protein
MRRPRTPSVRVASSASRATDRNFDSARCTDRTFGALPDPDELTALRRRFQLPALGIDTDTSTLNDQHFDPLIIGGTRGFIRLVDHCRKVVEADAAKGGEAEAAY